MKTIEERANDYVGHPFEIDEFSSASIKRQAFIDGAEEQRKIDIEKACELIEKALQKLTTYKDKDNFTENEFKIITVSRVPNWLIKFRKEMEE